ncbi:MAG TPA: AmmeMemoRadiSam system radical SAM enzyme [Deltaproteobacteria bacterium]|nr:AmmeMemoRadiSam system radical SAM enzyme [Deltaproteobacteria bacterium]
MIEARLYDTEEGGRVVCRLCAFRCRIAPGKRGVCGVRENRDGRLYSLVYNRLIAGHADPVEKKPLFHFMPGSVSYSVSTVGCNFRCLHCQNADISQMPRNMKKILGDEVSPDEIVATAVAAGAQSISYTYTEPTIFFEYAFDTMKLAREKGLGNIFVTNGYMTGECLDELKGLLDAANVDLKSFSDDFYRKVCGARLAPVLDSIEYMHGMGVWLEITTLVIPTRNDSPEELRGIARWIAALDRSIPWHISAFHPAYRLANLPRTPVSVLDRAREIGLEEGLCYVYTGNVPGDPGENTYCHRCGEAVIKRWGFTVRENLVKEGRCPCCGEEVAGVFDAPPAGTL